MNSPKPQQAASQLGRLLTFLEHDPDNLSLLSDAIAAAYDEQAFEQAAQLLLRYGAQAPLPPHLRNLEGLVALAQQRYGDAAEAFALLRREAGDNPALRFNEAWAKAMAADYGGALELLDDETLAASPAAPPLKIQMMHHLEMYDEALEIGAELAERHADNDALMGALATLAMDAEKLDLARHYAERGSASPDGAAALGMLVLGDQDAAGSLALFEQALAQQPRNPRAWVGKGLSLLISGDTTGGAQAIDKGAELFGDHLGSWIASGWAHFVAGDTAGARGSFERALAADPNFAESHGGLAVLDVLENRLDQARRNTEIALRLDRKCFGAALAASLMLERGGEAERAKKIRDIALNTPIGPNGMTIAQAMVGFSSGLRK